MVNQRLCKDCDTVITVYNTLQNRCIDCQRKRQKPEVRKPLAPTGKQGEYYRIWRDTIARPYLDKEFGRDCANCKAPPPVDEETGEIGYHEVDHINKRGSNQHLKYKLGNVRYLCHDCHRAVT